MSKKIYEVVGHVQVEVKKRVKAKDEHQAIELAQKHFKGLFDEWNNNSIFLRGEGEEISEADGVIEWKEAYETDSKDYDTEADTETTYTCKICGNEVGSYTDSEFDYFGEEELWGHIQRHHEEEFEDYQDLETPDMLEICYERKEN